MNCRIESMSDNRRNNVDTLPPRGRVNEVRREWLVHEDEALAYRLQDEEIKQHLTGNKSRNVQIREDIPRAKDEQRREAEEAARMHQQLLLQQEQQDARVAAQLADIIEKEEEDRRRMLEEEDKELARLLQEKEKQRIERRERERRELETHTPRKEAAEWRRKSSSSLRENAVGRGPDYPHSCATPDDDDADHSRNDFEEMNRVGLPLQEDIVQPFRTCTINSYPRCSRGTPSPPLMSEEEARRIQEEKDEELARYLQEKENLENIDTLNRDRLLAIETQDKELARLLQEKERAKARRARERAREKAALKRMQEEGGGRVADGGLVMAPASDEQITIKTAETVQVSVHKPPGGEMVLPQQQQPPPLHSHPRQARHGSSRYPPPKTKPRYPDPEEIVELEPERSGTPLSNIAMTIDPTYAKEGTERSSKTKKSASKYGPVEDPDRPPGGLTMTATELVEDVNAPPYMPIQGQRRLPEKKMKQKDGCKQQ